MQSKTHGGSVTVDQKLKFVCSFRIMWNTVEIQSYHHKLGIASAVCCLLTPTREIPCPHYPTAIFLSNPNWFLTGWVGEWNNDGVRSHGEIHCVHACKCTCVHAHVCACVMTSSSFHVHRTCISKCNFSVRPCLRTSDE